MGERTIWRLWQNGIAVGHPDPAYLTETVDGWREVSWHEAAERVEHYANGLLARGIRKGDAFALLARTTFEWALFDFALAHVGAVGAAIYANSSPKDVHYVLEHSDSVGVLCEDAEQLAKVEAGRADLPRLREVLTYQTCLRSPPREPPSRNGIPMRSQHGRPRSTRTTSSRSSTRRARPGRRRRA